MKKAFFVLISLVYSMQSIGANLRIEDIELVEALNARKEKYVWPDFLGKDTDPSQSLEKLSIPGLWIFSDNDRSIPVDLSIDRLQTLRRSGHRYDYVLFSGLGHNNMDRTFSVATDWIRRLSK
jgi:pimeloyl-ACP methyl ester carboxylesterase